MSDSGTTPSDSNNKSIHLVSIPEDGVLSDRHPNEIHAAILQHRKIEPLQQKKACLVLVTLVIIDVVIVSAVIGISLRNNLLHWSGMITVPMIYCLFFRIGMMLMSLHQTRVNLMGCQECRNVMVTVKRRQAQRE